MRENEGQVEKHYTIVLYAESKHTTDGKRPTYYFKLAGEGLSAKCPPKIFGEDTLQIPNDCNYFIEKLKEYKNGQSI